MTDFQLSHAIKYDSEKLKELMDIWTEKSDIASPLFLAMNIMDFTNRLKRHLMNNAVNERQKTAEIKDVLKTAETLVIRDNNLADLVFTHISFREFHCNLESFTADYTDGKLYEEELDELTFDIVDHYFSTELVLWTAEDLVKIPDELNKNIENFRSAFKEIISVNVDLAEAARQYAETAPGGSELHPWPELLNTAPDPVFDAIWAAENQNLDDFESLTLKPLEFLIDREAARLSAAGTDQPLYDKYELLYSSEEFELRSAQDNDIFCFELIGDDSKYFPDLYIFADGEKLNIQPSLRKSDYIIYSVGKILGLKGKTLTIDIPGIELPIPSVIIR